MINKILSVLSIKACWPFFFFFLPFYSLFSSSLSCALFMCIVCVHDSQIVEKFDFHFFLPLLNPKSNIFSSLKKPSKKKKKSKIETLNPQILLNHNPPQAHVNKFSNFSYVIYFRKFTVGQARPFMTNPKPDLASWA